MRIIDIILELIYPKKCVLCNEIIDFNKNTRLCNKCNGKLKPIKGNTCKICGVPIDINDICTLCREAEKHYFKRAFCTYELNEDAKTAVYNIKFHEKPQNLKYFIEKSSDWITDRKDFPEVDFIVSVPMTARDKNKRGYNQSEIYAKGIAKKLNVKFLPALKKVRRTKPQHTLKANERRKNLKNAFVVKNKYKALLRDKTILIVDDIFTTGTTTNECSRAMVKAGVKEVYVHCLTIVKLKK